MTLRSVLGLLAAAVALLGTSACTAGGSPAAPAQTRLTVGLSYIPDVQFSPFYVAAERGYFAEAGVSVELRHHGEAEELFGALANGTEDVVFASGDEIVQARSAGQDVLSIGTVYNDYPAALIVPEDSPIRSAGDVAGRTIGVPGPFGQSYFALLALLGQSGLGPGDVRIEHIGYTQQAALASGRVDAVMGYVNNDAVRFDAAGFPVRTISPFPAGRQTLVGPALAASSAAVQAKPEAMRAMQAALARAIDDILADPAGALPDAEAHIPTLVTDRARADALATLQATLPLLEPDGAGPRFRNDPAAWREMIDFMREQDLLGERTVLVEEVLTNELLPT